MTESVLGVKKRPQGTFDADLELKDAGLIAASAAAKVDSAAKVLDVGTGLFSGTLIIDVIALEIASNDEIYDIVVQGCIAEAFTAALVSDLAAISLSAAEVKRTDCNKDDTTGRYKLKFDNEYNGTFYQYIRVYTVVDGTIATGINYAAYVIPNQ